MSEFLVFFQIVQSTIDLTKLSTIFGYLQLIVCILVKIFLKIKEKINFSVENTREYQEVEPQSMEVDSETAPAIEALIQKYPEYMKVEDLPIEQLDTKMKVVQDLWEKKLLLTKEPLEAHYDD